MRAYANHFGEDAETWGITGLLHDFDYEKHPSENEHPWVGVKVLEELGMPEPIRTAILGHAEYTNTPRETLLARALYAVDELSGFVTAVALVRPSRSIHDVKPKSVKKKMKDKAFARGVHREAITVGAEELGVDLTEHIQFVIDAMAAVADDLGLQGVSPEFSDE
jgi:predicted hydrolase (HD superfamily)